jgi:hypothetical protein
MESFRDFWVEAEGDKLNPYTLRAYRHAATAPFGPVFAPSWGGTLVLHMPRGESWLA